MPASIKKKRKSIRLKTLDAIARLDEMYPRLLTDVGLAVAEYGALEGANNVATGEMKGVMFAGADTFNVVQQTIAHSLALRLAKLLDIPIPRRGMTVASAHNDSDVVSVPLMLRLISQERCLKVIEQRPGRSVSSVRRSVAEAENIWKQFRRSANGRTSLQKLRSFRNNLLAHILLSQAEIPTYSQMFAVYEAVGKIWERLRLAMTGDHWGSDAFTSHYLQDGERFWRYALRGASQRVVAGPTKK